MISMPWQFTTEIKEKFPNHTLREGQNIQMLSPSLEHNINNARQAVN